MHPAQVYTDPQLAEGLTDSPLRATPAEAHGLLCGLLCAGAPEAEQRWRRELFDPDGEGGQPQDLPPSLWVLAKHTRAEIEGAGLGLTLLLPGDQAPLRERAEALYDWTRGFIYGLGVAGLGVEGLSDQGREALADLAQITRMDLDGLEEGEEEENALMELQEFLWVAARLLHDERGHAGG